MVITDNADTTLRPATLTPPPHPPTPALPFIVLRRELPIRSTFTFTFTRSLYSLEADEAYTRAVHKGYSFLDIF